MGTAACIDNPVSAPSEQTSEPIRLDKVRRIRRLLARGHYDPDRRLDAVLDRLLEDILQ